MKNNNNNNNNDDDDDDDDDDDNDNNNNNNKVQTKTAAPLQDILFLCLYKGVEKNLQPRRCYFDPPRKQTTCTFAIFYQ